MAISEKEKGFGPPLTWQGQTQPPPAELFLLYHVNTAMPQRCTSQLCMNKLILAGRGF